MHIMHKYTGGSQSECTSAQSIERKWSYNTAKSNGLLALHAAIHFVPVRRAMSIWTKFYAYPSLTKTTLLMPFALSRTAANSC